MRPVLFIYYNIIYIYFPNAANKHFIEFLFLLFYHTFYVCICMHYLFLPLTWKYFLLLWLCSKGFVEGKHIMKLRQQLLNHGYCRTFTTDEKGKPNGDYTHCFHTRCYRSSWNIVHYVCCNVLNWFPVCMWILISSVG